MCVSPRGERASASRKEAQLWGGQEMAASSRVLCKAILKVLAWLSYIYQLLKSLAMIMVQSLKPFTHSLKITQRMNTSSPGWTLERLLK